MKEMVGGCCVCSDERGWPDNPLVYCDGNGCTVAVHQACYGIVTVPTGPWYCRKCESPERQARVRCELCPSKAGALKRADTGGWAHVVCALYIPEVRFGNVTSMEPIILQLIPAERFNKTCYICQEMGKLSRATAGACMQCNKSGCKQQFHVTCAQGLGLLCEEAGNYLDNVKYCGYCQHHYSKLKKGGNVKTIPPYKPITHDSHSSDSSPEKEVEGTPTGTSATNTTPTTTSTKGGNTKTSANRKSGHQNSSAASKTVQSSSKTQTTTSQAAFAGKSHHSSEKSSGSVKKASSPGEGQRRSSQHQDTNTTAASSASPASSNTKSATPTTSAGSVTPQSQSQPPTETTASSAAKGGLIQTSAAKGAIQQTPGLQASAPKTPTLQESPAAVSTIASTPTNTAASTIVSPPIIQPPQPVSLPPPPVPPPKFAPSTFTESVIANNDSAPSYVASDTKQTKKRKAVSQINSSALKEPTEYVPTAHPSPAAPPQAKTDITQPSVSMHGPLQTPPTSMQVDLSTSSLYQPSLPPPSLPIAGTSSSMDRGIGGHSATVSSIIHPSLSGPSTSGTSTSHTHLQVGKYGIPTSGVGESSRGEMPNSLLVSVPLPSAGQGLNLTSQHQMSEQNSTVVSSHSPLGSGSLGRTTSWGGLQVTYEMQPTQHQHMSQGIVDQTMTPVDGKRSSDKISGMSNSMGVPPVRNKKRAALNATVVSGSVATSTIQSTGLHQLPGPPPLSVPVKRAPGPPLPPPQQLLYQDTGIKDSPPSSPTPESSRAAKSSKVDKISRAAPHMLGNELNPGSAAAARLSEQLSAELAAHSVATAAANQAAGTLVPPPLLNKATSASKSGGTIIMGSGGAQSLDQLLERQWEQGSQFLMEQAQHFDIASLLSCLHQLRTENVRLEEHVGSLLQRRDHLLAVNARLAIPLNTANIPAEPARLPSQNGSQVRPPSTTVRTETAVSDRSHQLVIRDMQPKPS